MNITGVDIRPLRTTIVTITVARTTTWVERAITIAEPHVTWEHVAATLDTISSPGYILTALSPQETTTITYPAPAHMEGRDIAGYASIRSAQQPAPTNAERIIRVATVAQDESHVAITTIADKEAYERTKTQAYDAGIDLAHIVTWEHVWRTSMALDGVFDDDGGMIPVLVTRSVGGGSEWAAWRNGLDTRRLMIDLPPHIAMVKAKMPPPHDGVTSTISYLGPIAHDRYRHLRSLFSQSQIDLVPYLPPERINPEPWAAALAIARLGATLL